MGHSVMRQVAVFAVELEFEDGKIVVQHHFHLDSLLPAALHDQVVVLLQAAVREWLWEVGPGREAAGRRPGPEAPGAPTAARPRRSKYRPMSGGKS